MAAVSPRPSVQGALAVNPVTGRLQPSYLAWCLPPPLCAGRPGRQPGDRLSPALLPGMAAVSPRPSVQGALAVSPVTGRLQPSYLVWRLTPPLCAGRPGRQPGDRPSPALLPGMASHPAPLCRAPWPSAR